MFANNFPQDTTDQASFAVSEDFDLNLNGESQFNYGLLNTEARIVTKQRASEIKSLMQRSSQNIIEIGQKLIEVKEQLQHGQFEDWLRAELDWSEAKARKFMQVARQFKTINFTVLDIAPSALYEIAAPSTPQEARREVIKRAKQGEKITYTKARSITAQHKQAKLKETEQAAVDTQLEAVDREASVEPSTIKHKKNRPDHTSTQPSLDLANNTASVKVPEVELESYATPLQNLATVMDASNSNVDADQDKELFEDQEESRQPLEREQAIALTTAFEPLQQEDQIEVLQPEVAVQSVETVEVQVVKVAEEVDREYRFESSQETVNREYQLEDTQDQDVIDVESETMAGVIAVSDPPQRLVTAGAPSSDSKVENSEDHSPTALHTLYCILTAKILEYISASPNLKFSEFDEAAREFTSSTEITDILDQEAVEDIYKGLAPRISVNQIADTLSVSQLHNLSQSITSRISKSTTCFLSKYLEKTKPEDYT